MALSGSTPLGDFVADPSVDGWDIALAIVVLIASWIISSAAKKAVLRLTARVEGISPALSEIASRVVKYFVFFLGIGITLSILGAPIQPLIAAAIIAAVIMYLTLRGVAENFGASVVLQTRRPFLIGDEVELMGYNGSVKEINGQSVVIETFDGRTVHLPNRELLDHPIVNNSTIGARRTEVEIRIASATDANIVLDLIHSTLFSIDTVLKEPAALVGIRAVEGERLTVRAQFWHSPSDGAVTTAAVVAALSSALSAGGTHVTVISPPPVPPLTPPATI